jgi:archaemetzincin
MSQKKTLVGVVPFGNIPEIIPKAVAAIILGYLNLDADVLLPLEHPAYAYDQKRLQYDAGTILKDFEYQPFNHYSKIIGVLEVDLFIPIFTFVFGEAKQGGRHALVSSCRLRKDHGGAIAHMSLLLERTGKVALHELGHLFNLHHCMDRKCLMHFLSDTKDLDMTPLNFCRYCSVYLRDVLRRIM